VHGLGLLIGAAIALALAPGLLSALRAGGGVRPNYRGRLLPFPFGALIAIAAAAALGLATALQQATGARLLHPETRALALYVLGIAFLGLLDDLLGDTLAGAPRGVRAHARAALAGRPSTGALKALGAVGLALYSLSALDLHGWRWPLAAAVLVAATALFNQLDLRPGRAGKALAALGVALTLGAGPRALYSLGPFLGAALVAGAYDLRERAMLGDCGASVLGALAGWWLVLTLPAAGQAVALAALLALAAYGELRSISELVERLPLLRRLDSAGRP
jgi:UDP-GlcNAc:undecaprenyl-phosphate/decaprenyl-phosphate GlcNAc-1-phosphate transferase